MWKTKQSNNGQINGRGNSQKISEGLINVWIYL